MYVFDFILGESAEPSAIVKHSPTFMGQVAGFMQVVFVLQRRNMTFEI